MRQSFMQACLSGEATSRDVDQYVKDWHRQADNFPGITLQKWLGFTDEEYGIWVTKPYRLSDLIEARRKDQCHKSANLDDGSWLVRRGQQVLFFGIPSAELAEDIVQMFNNAATSQQQPAEDALTEDLDAYRQHLSRQEPCPIQMAEARMGA